jgi:hydrogenase maturation protease
MIGVIGIGNVLRGDDGIGINIIQRLQEIFMGNAKLKFINFGEAELGLINTIKQFPEVLLIDAVDAGLQPAAMRIFSLEEAFIKSARENFSTHELTLSGIFQLLKGLGLKVKVFVAGIQVKDMGYGKGLSDELRERAEGITQEIVSYLRDIKELK